MSQCHMIYTIEKFPIYHAIYLIRRCYHFHNLLVSQDDIYAELTFCFVITTILRSASLLSFPFDFSSFFALIKIKLLFTHSPSSYNNYDAPGHSYAQAPSLSTLSGFTFTASRQAHGHFLTPKMHNAYLKFAPTMLTHAEQFCNCYLSFKYIGRI